MSKLSWNDSGERLYYTGVKKGVLFVHNGAAYGNGTVWDGLISITESPSGAETTPLYAGDSKYAELQSLEEFGFSVEAYMYPDEFADCIGQATIADGVVASQQERKTFGMSYVNTIGNDTEGNAYGYEIHLVYGAKAAPSERSHSTINDSPEAETMSWECTTTPVTVKNFKDTSHLIINSKKADATKLKALEDILYGTDEADARLPLPEEVIELMTVA